jgi:hypothetical protein
MHSHQGTSEPYGTEGGRGGMAMSGGIVSARLEDMAGALETTPEELREPVQAEKIPSSWAGSLTIRLS